MNPTRADSYRPRIAVVMMAVISVAATTPPQPAMKAPPPVDAVRIAVSEPPAGFIRNSKELSSIIADLRAGNAKRANATWAKVLEAGLARRAPADIETLIQWVLRESYLETQQELADYAAKVRYYNDAKKAIRTEVTEIKDELQSSQSWPRKISTIEVRSEYVARQAPVQSTGTRVFQKAEAESYLTILEDQLNTIGDDAQLANVDLQNLLQKQQQTLQMMSNISKMLYDTAQAVIRKIGG